MDQGLVIGAAAQPAIRFVPNSELDEREEAEKKQNQPQISSLVAHMKTLLQRAKEAKTQIQQEIINDYQARNGKYSDDKLAEIRKFGGSEIYMMLTNEKDRSVESHIKEIVIPDGGEWPFSLEPSPISDLPEAEQMDVVNTVMGEAGMLLESQGVEPDMASLLMRTGELNQRVKKQLQEAAKLTADRMERQIQDQMVEGNWEKAVSACVYDFSTTKACILKGPFVKRCKQLKWAKTVDGKTIPDIYTGYKIWWQRRSPLDIYPSADAEDIQDGYLFDRYQLSVQELNSMRDMKGVDNEAINMVIEEYGRSGYREIETGDQQRATVEQRPYSYWSGYSSTIEGWQFWGAVPGFLLEEWGMEVEDKHDVYHVNAWLIGNYVVKATINEDPLGRRPYSKTSFEKLPGSFWGRGPSELLRDLQDICNALARAIVNNSAMASGPQVAINDSSRIPEGENVDQFWPWKVWQFGPDKMGSSGHRPPIEFFQPNMMVEQLLRVFQFFSQKADTVIGMPSYPMGELSNAAASTASGMSMALNQAGKGTKSVVKNVDIDLIKDQVSKAYEFNMLYNPDESIKGDLVCVPRGSSAMLVKENMQMRRQEFLQRTNNPVDLQIMTVEGRANLLAEAAKSLDMPVDKIIPWIDDVDLQKQVMLGIQKSQQPVQESRQLDNAGNPVSGQDTALFNQ